MLIKGKKEECLAIVKALREYVLKELDWYKSHGYETGRYYTYEVFEAYYENPEEEVEEAWKNGWMEIDIDEPSWFIYQHEPFMEELYIIIAIAAPNCMFDDVFDFETPSGSYYTRGMLKNGLLYLKTHDSTWEYYQDMFHEENNEEYDEKNYAEYEEKMEKWIEEYSGKAWEEFKSNKNWDSVYSPVKKMNVNPNVKEGDSAIINIEIIDSQGNFNKLSLSSEAVERPLDIHCFPEKLLETNNIDSLVSLLTTTISSFYEGETEKVKKEIASFGNKLKDEFKCTDLSKLVISRIIDTDAPFFFFWLRSQYSPNGRKMIRLAEEVCSDPEENKEKSINKFRRFLNKYEPSFSMTKNSPSWPTMCLCHVDEEGSIEIFKEEAKSKLVSKMDISHIADSVEEFAQLIISDVTPHEYAIERIGIDYDAGTIKHTAEYIPGYYPNNEE